MSVTTVKPFPLERFSARSAVRAIGTTGSSRGAVPAPQTLSVAAPTEGSRSRHAMYSVCAPVPTIGSACRAIERGCRANQE